MITKPSRKKTLNSWLVRISEAILLAFAPVILPDSAFCQDTLKSVPDGTEGDSLATKKNIAKTRSWNTFDLGFTTFKVGAAFLYEYAGFGQDATGRQQMNIAKTPLEPGFDIRDFRFLLSGQLNTKRTITWKAGIMYDGSYRSWFIRETGIMIAVPELWGSFFIGRTKEGISMSKVMSGYAVENMERYMASDAIPILADGIKWLGFEPKSRVFWNLGIFNDLLSRGQSFSTYSWQFASRVGWLPVYSPATKTLLHMAVNFRIGQPVNDSIAIKSRPESNIAPIFINSGKFQTDQSTYLGYEIYYSTGPWLVGSEYFWDRFSSTSKHNPVFKGGQIMASYILTGESRPYSPVGAIYGYMPVKRPVFKGGPGAWEIVMRYSTDDINGGTITGGKFWRFTPMVNWYLSDGIRFEFAYGYGVLDRYNLSGATNFFQTRFQFMLK